MTRTITFGLPQPEDTVTESGTDQAVGRNATAPYTGHAMDPVTKRDTPPVQASAQDAADVPENFPFVAGAGESVRVETTIYRAFVEGEGGELLRAMPAGVSLVPTSWNSVSRRLQRAALYHDVEQTLRDEEVTAALTAVRHPSRPIAIIDQQAPAFLPVPEVAGGRDTGMRPGPAARGAPNASRVEVVSQNDPRVQQFLAHQGYPQTMHQGAWQLPGPAPVSRWMLAVRIVWLLVYVGVGMLALLAVGACIPATRPQVYNVINQGRERAAAWLRGDQEQHAVTPAVPGAADEWVWKRTPTISCNAFTQLLVQTPLVRDAPTICANAVARGFDPAPLAEMVRTALMAKEPTLAVTHNIFSMMRVDGTPEHYDSYTAGVDAFLDGLENTYIPEGITSLPTFVSTYCMPPTCDTSKETTRLKDAVRALRLQSLALDATPKTTLQTTSITTTAGIDVTSTPLATGTSTRVSVQVTGVTNQTDTKAVLVEGTITNVSANPLTIPSQSLVLQSAGVGYSLPPASGTTPLAPGASTPFSISVPVASDAPLDLQVTLGTDDPIHITLR